MAIRRTRNDNQLTSEHFWVLKRLHGVGYTSSLIAGGAVRDTYFKKEIRDIDIYVLDPKYGRNEPIMQAFRNIIDGSTLKHLFKLSTGDAVADNCSYIKGQYSKHYYVNKYVTNIRSFKKNGQEYQIITLNIVPERYVLNHFNVNISRCYCDGTKMRYTHEFLQDAHHHTITIAGDIPKHNYERSMKVYVPKIKRKFPNFKIVDTLKDTYKE